MKQQNELTAADFALYLGCEVEWMRERGYFLAGINTGQENFNPVGLVSEQMEPVWVKFDEITPILRPLSDMTEEEARDVYYIRNGEVFNPRPEYWPENHADISALDDLRSDVELYQEDIRFVIGEPAAWHYLLAHHFDLFGWIDAGLAIKV